MSKISRFTSETVRLAKMLLVADYAVVSLHYLRIYLAKSYREALDLLSKMPHILTEIGLKGGDLPHHSTLVKAIDRLQMNIWRVLLCLSAQLHDTADHAPMYATFFDRETVSKHSCRQTNYRVQTLRTTALVDTKTQAVLDVHCTTEKRYDTQIGGQLACRNAGEIADLAADKGYDWM